MLSAYLRQDVATLETQLLDLRRGIFTADTTAPGSAALLHELAELRASEALAQADETAQQAYLSTNRAALLAERARLQPQLGQLAQEVVERAPLVSQ